MNDMDETFEEWSARWKQEWDARVRASRLFNAGAIDRLVTAVGRPPSDRDALANELERLARIYSTWHDANDRPPDGETGKWFDGLESDLAKVRHRLANPPHRDPDILRKSMIMSEVDPYIVGKIWNTFDGLELAKTVVGKILREKSYALGRIGSRYGAAHWLIGEALPRVYAQYFGGKFGYSRDKDSGVPSGPGIRFILEVLQTMKIGTPRDGKPFGPDAIEHYLKSGGY